MKVRVQFQIDKSIFVRVNKIFSSKNIIGRYSVVIKDIVALNISKSLLFIDLLSFKYHMCILYKCITKMFSYQKFY